MELLKSKIFWMQVVSVLIVVIGALQPQFPQWAEILAVIASVLTIILRQLQGKTINVLGKSIDL